MKKTTVSIMLVVLFLLVLPLSAFAGGSSVKTITVNTDMGATTIYGTSVTASSSGVVKGQAQAISNTGSAFPVKASVAPGSSSTELTSINAYPGTGYKLSSEVTLSNGSKYRVKVYAAGGYTTGRGMASIG